jgi:hypothetical protein
LIENNEVGVLTRTIKGVIKHHRILKRLNEK